MFDRRLRTVKRSVLEPIVRRSAGRIRPAIFTALGFVLTIGAGAAAWQGWSVVAVLAWLIGRTFDGLDGETARADGTATDRGAYTDLLLDTIGYTAVPIGLAFGADDIETWRIVAVLVATFYVNSVSLLMLSALLEKNARGAAARNEPTSVAMPSGLIEGAETILLFTIALAVPSIAKAVFVVMAIGVMVGVGQRALAARHLLAVPPSE